MYKVSLNFEFAEDTGADNDITSVNGTIMGPRPHDSPKRDPETIDDDFSSG